MTVQLPDVTTAAREIIERARNDRPQYIDGPVDRVSDDTPWADREILFSGLVEFHHERLSEIPSAAKYPEAQPWVEHRLAVEHELAAAGLSDWDRAVLGGMNDYLAFRGYRLAAKKRADSSLIPHPSLLVRRSRKNAASPSSRIPTKALFSSRTSMTRRPSGRKTAPRISS